MISHSAALAKLRASAPRQTRKARKRKPKLAPVAVQLPCVILAVDTARKSGWCIRAPYWMLPPGCAHAMSNTFAIDRGDTDVIVKLAEGMAADSSTLTDRDIVLVLERSWGGGNHQIEGLGAARHAWEAGWRRRGMTRRRIVRVYPATWRSAVLGVTRGDNLAQLELATASRLIGSTVTDRDEAAAICIAEWASRAGEVAAVLPRPRKVSAALDGPRRRETA